MSGSSCRVTFLAVAHLFGRFVDVNSSIHHDIHASRDVLYDLSLTTNTHVTHIYPYFKGITENIYDAVDLFAPSVFTRPPIFIFMPIHNGFCPSK